MAEQAGYGRRAAPDLERAKVAPWFQNPIQRIWTLIFPILNKPPTCHCHLPVQTPQCQLGFRMTLRGGKERQIALTRTEGQASARHPPPPAVPARSTVQRLTRGVARAVARGQPEARARAEGQGRGRAARQQVGTSSRARARAAPFPSRSPRGASPPRRERAPPALAPGLSRFLRAAHSSALLPQQSSRPWLSSPQTQPRPLGVSGLLPSLRHSPSFSLRSLPPGTPREPGYEAGGLERELEKWRFRAWIMPSTAPPALVRR